MKVAGIIPLLLLCYFSTLAQPYREIVEKNAGLTFKQQVEKVEIFYKDKDKGKGSGYKQFKRWEYFNARRLDAQGRIQNVPRRLLDEFDRYQKQAAVRLNYDCGWESVGGTAYERIVSGHNGGLGRINCLVADPADPDIIYAGTPAGGLWSTNNGGGTWNTGSTAAQWTPLSDGLPNIGVSGIAIDHSSPTSSRTLYILTGDGDGGQNPSIGVLKSLDGGATWYSTGLSWGALQLVFGYKLVIHPTNANILFAVTDNGIFRTQNGGVSWTNVQIGSFFDIEFRPGTPDTMYATTRTGFFRSTDGGVTWNAINCGFTTVGSRLAVAVTPADPDVVYVLSGGNLQDAMGNNIAGTFRGIYRSNNSGACFTRQTTTPNILGGNTAGSDTRQQSGYDLALAVSPTDANIVHVGGINSWRSTDAGVTWTLTAHWNEDAAGAGDYNHADVHALEYIDGVLYSGSDGGVFRTTNNADDWENVSQGLKITQFYRIDATTDGSNNYIFGGAQDNGLNRFLDTGSGFGNLQHWEGGDGFETTVDPGSDLAIGGTQNGNLYRFNYMSDNGYIEVTPGSAGSGAWLTPHTYDAANDAILAGYTDIWRTTDNGGSWTNYSNGNIGAGLCAHIEVAPSNSNVVYVSKDLNPGSRLYRTTDGGANWSNITGTLPANNNIITYFAIHPTDPNQIWVTLGGFTEETNPPEGYQAGNKVFYSPDGGATWQNMSGTLPNISANCIVYENGSANGLYVGMDVGVYYRDNTMSDWVLFSNNLPNVIVSELDINYATGSLVAGTFGRGAWSSKLFSACNRVCLDCPTFSGLQSPSNIYSSQNCIYSSAEIYDSTRVAYRAEEFILLTDLFFADGNDGAVFHGAIQACNPASPGPMPLANNRDLPGFYIGILPNVPLAGKAYSNGQRIGQPENGLRVFPNPTSGQLTLECNLPQDGPVYVALYDIAGKLLTEFENTPEMDAGPYNKRFDLSGFKNGTYILEFTYNGKRSFQTVILIN